MAKQYDSGVHPHVIAKAQEAVTFNGTFNTAPDVFVTSYFAVPAKGTGATSITTTGFDIYSENTGDTGWIARETGFDDPFMAFTSQADVTSNTSSDIINLNPFESQADVTSNTSSDIINLNPFESQADITSDISSDINTEREFTVQADSVGPVVSDIRIYTQEGPWFTQYYKYRKRITLDSTSGSSNLTDFPVLINHTDADLRDTTNGGYVELSNGQDILFTDSGGTILLDFQIEKYDPTTGELVAWAKTSLHFSSETYIYIYYGNENSTDLSNAAGVWDDNFDTVWHLNELATGAANEYDDSTGNLNYGTASGGVPSRIDGKIGYGQDLDAGEEINHWNGFNSILSNSGTISLWVQVGSTLGNVDEYIAGIDGVFYLFNDGGDVEFWIDTAESGLREVRGGGLLDNEFVHLAGTWDGTNQILYVNGVEVDSLSLSQTLDPGYNLKLGLDTDDTDQDVDELHLSQTARNATWIATEYTNQNDPTSFYSVGDQQINADWFDNNWIYRKQITIEESEVSGTSNHTDFPILVNFTDVDFKDTINSGHVGRADGGDILFTSDDGQTQLDHEIEKYDPTTGELVAWVRIPDLNYHIDTPIFVYYGNTASATQVPTGVWDSNYSGVYHLQDSYTLDADDVKDSTINAKDGTVDPALISQVDGKIDKAQYFDGTGNNIGIGDVLGGAANGTVSAWIRHDGTIGTANERYVSVGSSMFIRHDGDGALTFAVKLDGAYELVKSDDGVISAGVWYYVTGSWDGTTSRVYLNGVELDSSTPSGVMDTSTGSSIASSAAPLTGDIDEARVSQVARDTSWILTEYNNQNSPSTFYTVGVEEKLISFITTSDTVFGATSSGNAERELSSTADIVWDATSDIINTNTFETQADIVWDATSDADAERIFTSTSNVVWDAISDIFTEREFTSTSDTTFDATSDIFTGREFASTSGIVCATSNPIIRASALLTTQADLVFDATSDIDNIRDFSTQANLVFDATSDIDLQNHFSSTPTITWDATSDFEVYNYMDFRTYPDIGIFIYTNVDIYAIREFASTSNMVFDTASDIETDRQFTSQADVVFDATSDIINTNPFVSQADVVFDESSDIFTERKFASTTDVVWDATSDIDFTDNFAVQSDVVFDAVSDITNGVFFTSTADVVFDESSDIFTEREFTSTADIAFESASDSIYVERQFDSIADIVFDATSDITNGVVFECHPEIVHIMISDVDAQDLREFSSTANIVSDITSDISDEPTFRSQADISIETASDISIFAEREFGSTSDTVWASSSDIQIDKKFTSQADISIESASDISIFAVRQFTSTTDIIWDVTSDISNENTFSAFTYTSFDTTSSGNVERELSSTADIVWDATSDIDRAIYEFTSQADIVFDATSDIRQELSFSVGSDIEFSTSSDISTQTTFKIQPSISWNINDPSLARYREFVTQADVVFDTISDIEDGFMFSCNPGVSYSSRSLIRKEIGFGVDATISWDATSNIINPFLFVSTADIEWDITTTINGYRELASSPDTVWDINDPAISVDYLFVSQADIETVTSADIYTTREFASTADVIAFITDSDIFTEREFASTADVIAFITDSDIKTDKRFSSTVGIVWDIPIISSNIEREFGSQGDVVWNMTADIDTEREFTSTADIGFGIVTDIFVEREFTSTADTITTVITSDVRNEREFTSQADDIVFETESGISNDIQFNSSADLIVDVPSVNMFKSNLFKSYPNIEYDIESGTFDERNFSVDPEISIEIEENSIYTERSFSSTVNIIINIESKNIWNLSIQDLMTRTSFRSVTPKRTATIVAY